MPITTIAKKKSGHNHPYFSGSCAVHPNPYKPAPPSSICGITSTMRNSGSYTPLFQRVSSRAEGSDISPVSVKPRIAPMKAPVYM